MTSTGQILNAVRAIRQHVTDAQADASQALDAAQELMSRAAQHRWDGMAACVGQAQALLETVLAGLGDTNESLDATLSTLSDIAAMPEVSEIALRLGSATDQLAGVSASVDAAAHTVRDAADLAAEVEATTLLDLLQPVATGLDAAQHALADSMDRIEAAQQAAQSWTSASGVGGSTPLSDGISGRPLSHGARMRRGGETEGPVRFRLPRNLSADEVAQAREYVDAGNKLLAEGRLSPTGRVRVSGTLAREKLKAAEAERRRAATAGEPYGKMVAAHLVDTTWTGQPEPPAGWGRHTHRVNSVLGSLSGQYPVGYTPTSFEFEDDAWDSGQPGQSSLER